MTTDTEIQHAVATEYLALADPVEPLSDASWDTPSLCDAWRVREVIAHMTMPARYDQETFMAELRARDFDFGRLSNDIAARDGGLPREALVADLRSETLHRWVPPEGGARGALNHATIHGLDVAVPLGSHHRPSDATLRVVLDDLTAGQIHQHFGIVIDGRRLEATDLDWSFGAGREIRAMAADLALLLCGRKIPSERFEGVPL